MKRAAVLVACLVVAGCYKCIDPQCSNVPPIDPAPPDWYPPPGAPIEVLRDDSLEAATSPCGRACANLKQLGCSEGDGSQTVSCYRICLRQASLSRIPAECWASAHNVQSLRACGLIRCVP